MSRFSPITDNLFIIDNLIFDDKGILYNFLIKNHYIELRFFLSNFIVGIVPFDDEFYMWDNLSNYLKK